MESMSKLQTRLQPHLSQTRYGWARIRNFNSSPEPLVVTGIAAKHERSPYF